jgi:hypothetical protein
LSSPAILDPTFEQEIAPAPARSSAVYQSMLRDAASALAMAKTETTIVSGRKNILAMKGLLVDLSRRHGQQGAMDHLEYFLDSKESRIKEPHLVLIGERLRSAGISTQTVLGAVLLYEHRVLGFRTKIFVAEDGSGRRTLLAPARVRLLFARLAAEALMNAGARAATQSFCDINPLPVLDQEPSQRAKKDHWTYATYRRVARSYLPLEPTMDATMARIGQRTRSNMRYYRRRAVAQLGCEFVDKVQIGRAEFLAFNRECAFCVRDSIAEWRYDSLHKFEATFLYGIRDKDGRWLSLIGGRHYDDAVEMDWQMNRQDLPAYSLSAVMRCFLMEHEIGRGSKRFFIDGGTPHPLKLSFATHTVHDLAVARRSRVVWMIRRSVPVMLKIVNRFAPKSNYALRLLTDPGVVWRPWS